MEHRNLKVGHYVEQSGPDYNLLNDNCWRATDRMTDLAVPLEVRAYMHGRAMDLAQITEQD